MGLTRMNPYFLSVVLILHIFDFYFDLGFCLTVTLNGCGQRTFVELAFPMEYDNFDLGFTAKDGPQSEAAWIRIGLPFIPDGGKEYTTQDPNTGTSVTERLKVRVAAGGGVVAEAARLEGAQSSCFLHACCVVSGVLGRARDTSSIHMLNIHTRARALARTHFLTRTHTHTHAHTLTRTQLEPHPPSLPNPHSSPSRSTTPSRRTFWSG